MGLNVFATVIFFLAIIHMLVSDQFLRRADRGKREKFSTSLSAFLGNAALIFGLWLIPIIIWMSIDKGVESTYTLLKTTDMVEPFSYFVLISIATVRPLRNLFDALMQKISHLFKDKIAFFWGTVLIVSSLLTGVFSGIAIMTLVCLYLTSSFFALRPSPRLSYATFTLLLLSIAVGSSIIPINFNFFMEALNGNWSHWEMFRLFGWKALIALLIIIWGVSTFFRKEFRRLQLNFSHQIKAPNKISLREILYLFLFFIASIGKGNFYVLLMVLALIIILHKPHYRIKGEEGELSLYYPLLIAFFTYTLEVHANLQKWWVLPLFENLQSAPSFFASFFLTGLNEHVPLEALKTTLKGASEPVKFFSYLGVMAGGALTIIAKSANIVAKFILKQHFPHGAVSPLKHTLYSLPVALAFSVLITLLALLGWA